MLNAVLLRHQGIGLQHTNSIQFNKRNDPSFELKSKAKESFFCDVLMFFAGSEVERGHSIFPTTLIAELGLTNTLVICVGGQKSVNR